MSGRVTYTDAALEAMLRRRADRDDPIGLPEAVFAALVVVRPRRGLSAAVAWRGFAAPRPAWAVLLLLIGLLLAMLGGALLTGSQPQRWIHGLVPPVIPAAKACPPGSTPDVRGPADQARPPAEGIGSRAFDRRTGQIVYLARGTAGAETWLFDVCTNTWAQAHPADSPLWGPLVYDAGSDRVVAVERVAPVDSVMTANGIVSLPGGYRAWAYDAEAGVWTKGAVSPTNLPQSDRRIQLAYDPTSGLVVVGFDTPDRTGSDLWGYDLESDSWTPLGSSGITATDTWWLIAYDDSAERLVSWEIAPANRLSLVDLRTGTTTSASEPPEMWFNWLAAGTEMAYHEALARTFVISGGRVVSYTAVADRWEVLFDEVRSGKYGWCSGAHCLYYPSVVYDAVNERLVVYGGSSDPDGSGENDGVATFNPATGIWTTLLERTSR